MRDSEDRSGDACPVFQTATPDPAPAVSVTGGAGSVRLGAPFSRAVQPRRL